MKRSPIRQTCTGCGATFLGAITRKFCTHQCAVRKGHLRRGKILARLAPTEHPSITDIAWAAGIHEGEGSATHVNGTVAVIVAQREPWLTYRLRALFGGSVSMTKRGYYYWHLSGARARGFVLTIYPWLSGHRRAQIGRAMVAYKTPAPARTSPPRVARGSANASAKLTEVQVGTIRALLANGYDRRQLCKCYGISKATLSLIATGQAWRHVA